MTNIVVARLAVVVVFFFTFAPLITPGLVLAEDDGGHPISVSLPPSPILPGDVVTLHGKNRFTPGQRHDLEFTIAGTHADVVFADHHTALVVVPPFLPSGPQLLKGERQKHHGPPDLVVSASVAIAPIHAAAAGGEANDPFRFGLNFGDPVKLSIGSTVSGWLQTTNIVTKGTTSPLSVSGKITSNVGGIVTVSLLADTSTGPEKLSLASLDPSTGAFFGTITSIGGTTRVIGTATVVIKPAVTRVPPRVLSVSPNPARAGDLITITGAGFGPTQATATVTWNGKPIIDILPVTSWSDTLIKARLATFDAGLAPLYVTILGIPSPPVLLEVIPPCPPVPEFVQRYGAGTLRGVQQTRDCGYVAVGSAVAVGRKDLDVLLVRTDPLGNLAFTRLYGGTGLDEAYAVQETSDRGYIIAGRTTSPEFNANASDMLLIKTNPQGVVEWQRAFGAGKDSGLGDEIAYSVQQTIDGGYIVAGVTNSYRTGAFDLGSRNVLLIKTDRNGTREWGRVYGGTADEEARSVRQTSDGGYVTAGFVTSGATTQAYVVKTAPYGEVEWTRTYTTGFGLDEFHSVRQATDGGLVFGGRARTKAGDLQFLMVRTDVDGVQTQVRTYGAASQEEAVSARIVDAGGVLLGGRLTSTTLDGLLVRADCTGAQVASRVLQIPGEDSIFAMETTFDGGSILAGAVRDTAGGALQTMLVKLRELAPPALEIQSFTSDGLEFREVRFDQSVGLAWTVRNATSIRLERLGGPGPAVDATFPGGTIANGTQALQFNVPPQSCFDGCEDTIYRLTAVNACEAMEAHVSLRTFVPQQVRDLFNAADVIVQKFGNGLPRDEIWINSHTRAALPPDDTCFDGQGKPFVKAEIPSFDPPSVAIDPREPLLVFYNTSDRLVGWAWSRKFDASTKPTGAPVPSESWFVHEGGWHLGTGGMTMFPNRADPPDLPYTVGCSFPCLGGPQLQGVSCSPFVDGCGATLPPYIKHPALWDVHVWLAPDDGVPRIGIFTTDVNLPDPCNGTGFGRTSTNKKPAFGNPFGVDSPQPLWVPFP